MRLINYFERKASGKIVQELEGLRFLAILPVVIQHCVERWFRNAYAPHLWRVADVVINYCLGGSAGVYLFFAISGFILPLPFAVKRLSGTPMGSLKLYFMRRLTRLEPPYILVMLLLAMAALLLHKMTATETAGYFFSGITYSSTIIYKHFNMLNPVIWSLEVEIQFYMAAPFITYLVFGIKDFGQRTAVIMAGIVLVVFIQEQTGISSAYNVLRFTLAGQLQYFMVGVLMVNFYLQQKLRPFKNTLLWDVAAVIAVFSMPAFLWVTGFGKTMLFVLVLAVLFAGAFKSGMFNWLIRRPWIMAIGGMCYSIYLLHLAIAQACIELVMAVSKHSLNSVGWFAIYALFFLLCLALVVPVFYLVIEKPCMDHSWPGRLKNFIKSKTGWGLSLEKTGGGAPGADKT